VDDVQQEVRVAELLAVVDLEREPHHLVTAA